MLFSVNPNLTVLKDVTIDVPEVLGESTPERAAAAVAARDTSTTAGGTGGGGEAGTNLNEWDEQNRPAVSQIAQLAEIENCSTYGAHDDATQRAGMAADCWPVSSTSGDQAAEWIMNNAEQLNVSYVIWNHHIWNPSVDGDSRPYSQWRGMADQGGATANHEDHIHVSFR